MSCIVWHPRKSAVLSKAREQVVLEMKKLMRREEKERERKGREGKGREGLLDAIQEKMTG